MERVLPCPKHEEQIKTLFKQDESINKRIDSMDAMKETLIEVKTLMGIMVEHSQKQDVINEKQNETLNNMNNNLTSMNQNLLSVDKRVGTLENRVDENEDKHKIDRREIERIEDTKVLSLMYKWGTPIGLLGLLALQLIKILKG